ncbi:MAG: hypothetical protein EBU84_07495 [Actinobacteria bacterium]|nr:hypothetical protein [Actinomycetota bacterium]
MNREYSIKDATRETRILYKYATDKTLPAESIRNDIQLLFREAQREANISNPEQKKNHTIHYLSSKLSKYATTKIVVPFTESIENSRLEADDEDKIMLEREMLLANMAERAFQNIGWESLAKELVKYYENNK